MSWPRPDDRARRRGLAADPACRLIGSPKVWGLGAALTSTLHGFETELLTRKENLVGLVAVNGDMIGQVETLTRSKRVVQVERQQAAANLEMFTSSGSISAQDR